MTTLAICGARDRFALGLALAEDPDQDSPAALRASWAKIQIWVGGRNLTAGIAASGAYRTEAECPALPVVKWLIDNWDALLHEERLPLPSHASSSAAWHVTSLKEALGRLQDEPENEAAWKELEDAVTAPGVGEDEVQRLLGAARNKHEQRREWGAVARLLELEIALSAGSAVEAPMQAELARIYNDELVDVEDDRGRLGHDEAVVIDDGRLMERADLAERLAVELAARLASIKLGHSIPHRHVNE